MEACKQFSAAVAKADASSEEVWESCDSIRDALNSSEGAAVAQELRRLAAKDSFFALLSSRAADEDVCAACLDSLTAWLHALPGAPAGRKTKAAAATTAAAADDAWVADFVRRLVESAFTVMGNHLADIGTLCNTFDALVAAVERGGFSHFGPPEWRLLFSALQRHSSDASLYTWGGPLLQAACNSPPAMTSLLSCDAVDGFMAFLHGWEARGACPQAAMLGCGAFLPVVAATAAGAKRLLDLGAAQWLAAVARIAPVADGSPLLVGLSHSAVALAEADGAAAGFREANLFAAALDAARRGLDDAETCRSLASALTHVLSSWSGTDGGRVAAGAFIDDGGVELVLEILARHGGDGMIAHNCCLLLCTLSVPVENLRFLVEAGVCEAMIRIYPRHCSETELSSVVVTFLCSVLDMVRVKHLLEHHILVDDSYARLHGPPAGSRRRLFMSADEVTAAQQRCAAAGAAEVLLLALETHTPKKSSQAGQLSISRTALCALASIGKILASTSERRQRAAVLATFSFTRLASAWSAASRAWDTPPAGMPDPGASTMICFYLQMCFEALSGLVSAGGEGRACELMRANVMPHVVVCVWRASLECESPRVAAAGFAALRSFAAYESCRKAVLGEGEMTAGQNPDLKTVPSLCSELLLKQLKREKIVLALHCTAECDHSPLPVAEASSADSSEPCSGSIDNGGTCIRGRALDFLPELRLLGGCTKKAHYRSWAAEAAESACELVATLSVAADLRKMLLASGWGEIAAAVPKRFALYPKAVLAACKCLEGLASEPSNCAELVAQGAVAAAAAALSKHKTDARVAAAACGVILKLAAVDELLEPLVQRNPAGAALALALRQHLSDSAVIDAAAAAVQRLASVEANRASLTAFGIADLLDAAAAHHDAASVGGAGSGSVAELCRAASGAMKVA